MRLPRNLALAVLAATAILLPMLPAAAADIETFFFSPDGAPRAPMIMTPRGGDLPNLDLGRDIEPGLLLRRSDLGAAESDPARFQEWSLDFAGERLVGFPRMVLWSAAPHFEADHLGSYTAYLLDCPATTTGCQELGEATAVVATGTDWSESTLYFPEQDVAFAAGHSLVVRVVVDPGSETDLMFAYGYPKYRSRLVVSDEAPAELMEAAAAAAHPQSPPPVDGRRGRSAVAEVTSSMATPPPSATTPGAEFQGWLATMAITTIGLVLLGAGFTVTLVPRRGRHALGAIRSAGRRRAGSVPSERRALAGQMSR